MRGGNAVAKKFESTMGGPRASWEHSITPAIWRQPRTQSVKHFCFSEPSAIAYRHHLSRSSPSAPAQKSAPPPDRQCTRRPISVPFIAPFPTPYKHLLDGSSLALTCHILLDAGLLPFLPAHASLMLVLPPPLHFVKFLIRQRFRFILLR
jgi:hypothetical protein